jgi:hypothetical protein
MEEIGEIGGSPVDGLIDLEIQMIQDSARDPSVDKIGGARAEIQEKAEAIFAPHMWDPAQEKSKVEDIVSFAVNDCGCDSPLALVNLLNDLKSKQGVGYESYDFMDGIWKQINSIRAVRAMKRM